MKIDRDTKNNIKEAIIVISCGATGGLLAAIGETGALILLFAIFVSLAFSFGGRRNYPKIPEK